jgi:hypothetical protein
VDIAALFQHLDDGEMDFAEVKGRESLKLQRPDEHASLPRRRLLEKS